MRAGAPTVMVPIGRRSGIEISFRVDDVDEQEPLVGAVRIRRGIRRREAIVVFGKRDRQAVGESRSARRPGKQSLGPLENVAPDGEAVDRAKVIIVLDQLAEAFLLFDARLAIDKNAVLDQHGRRHDEPHLLDLAQPFLVRGEFGGDVRHVSR